MNLALFDFDGTITHRDSFLDFLFYSQNPIQVIIGGIILFPVLLFYKLGILDNGKAKEIVLSYFFKGVNKKDFQKLCDDFGKQKLPKLFREQAVERIQWHLKQNDRVVVISASIENYLFPINGILGVEVVGTQLQFSDTDTFTGKIAGKNCYGQEKVSRLNTIIQLNEYKEIYAYGDSKGDKEMLSLAQQAFYKPFRS